MREIKVLGTGCAKCNKLEELTRQAVAEMGLDARVEKITDIKEILKHNIALTPALLVDGEVKIMGKVPVIEDLKKLLI